MKVLLRKFYTNDTKDVAKNLLGKTLIRKIGNQTLSGIITETEAYKGKNDPASHSSRKKTERNKIMFGEVGRAYVYFTYGKHYCFNVTEKKEEDESFPEWFTTPSDEKYFYVPGTATSDSLQLALDNAINAAFKDLAKRVDGRQSSKAKEIIHQAGLGDDSTSKTTIDKVTNIVTKDVKRVSRELKDQSNRFHDKIIKLKIDSVFNNLLLRHNCVMPFENFPYLVKRV